MSYLGFIQMVTTAYSHMDKIRVLEIGIDQGHSCFPIVHNLSTLFDDFEYVGIDIKVNSKITDGLAQMSGIRVRDSYECVDFNVSMYESNSLTILPKILSSNEKFDIVFLDGDHNYFTVAHELEIIEKLCHPHSIIVCDDYTGPGSTSDSFYSEREEYTSLRQNVENKPIFDQFGEIHIQHNKATPPIIVKNKEGECQGVRRAIDEFISSRPGWDMRTYTLEGRVVEAVALYQCNYTSISDDPSICPKTGERTYMTIDFKTPEKKEGWGFIND